MIIKENESMKIFHDDLFNAKFHVFKKAYLITMIYETNV